MTAPLEIPLQTARRLAVHKQLLDGTCGAPAGQADKEDILRVFEALRCVQIDPIRAVERTELLVLWSRLGRFEPHLLHELAYTDKRLMEEWAHCASLVLMKDLPLFRHINRTYAANFNRQASRTRKWLQENSELLEHIRGQLRERGPLATSDFSSNIPQVPWQSTGWTSGRNVPRVLDHLFTIGEVMVAGRDANRKLWALTRDFLPEHADLLDVDARTLSRRGLQLSLKALGAGTATHICNHFIRKGYPNWRSVLHKLEEEGLHVPARVRTPSGGFLKGDWFVHRDDAERASGGEPMGKEGRTVLLSPFDNLICDRQRTRLLFDFDYTIEIYVPAAKRKYGYYVLPILRGEEFLGRADLHMDRRKGQLRLQGLFLEDGYRSDVAAAPELAATVRELALFLGGSRIQLGRRMPVVWRRALRGEF